MAPANNEARSKAKVLADVLALASQFSVCVETFNLIHPSKDSDHSQRVALAKLGVQQGRLLVWGDAVGISSPPPNIAKHMIPSNPGLTNPDPNEPVNFGIRNPKLDDPETSEQVQAALSEIADRPASTSREQLMGQYGLKSPRHFSNVEHPALDTNRLEAFREKYALLQDLAQQTGIRPSGKRALSLTIQHWTVHNVNRFTEFVKVVRTQVDGLIALMDVKEQVDRSMRTDIKSMGWHPDFFVPIVRQDWDKLSLIREACFIDYPEYMEATETALKYIGEELQGTGISQPRAASLPAIPTRRHLEENVERQEKEKETEKEKRPSFLSHFKFKSWAKSSSRVPQTHSSSIPTSPEGAALEPQRSMSEGLSIARDRNDPLLPVRSKSLSAVPDEPLPSDLDSRLELECVPTQDKAGGFGIPIQNPADVNPLTRADTVNSLIDRHDMFRGVGRVETKDIRDKAHDWASGR